MIKIWNILSSPFLSGLVYSKEQLHGQWPRQGLKYIENEVSLHKTKIQTLKKYAIDEQISKKGEQEELFLLTIPGYLLLG